MPIEVLMPALSPTMTEGNLSKWLKQEGDKVSPGDVIAEIETDKATMEVEAVDEGILGKILIQAGTQAVPVNQLIALILEEGEEASILNSYSASSSVLAVDTKSNESVTITQSNISVNTVSANITDTKRTFASPLAKRLAKELNVDINTIQGHGPHGRVIKDDVLEASKNPALVSCSSKVPVVNTSGLYRNPEEYVKIPNDNMRKVIAKRLLESKQTIPHFYLNIECEMSKLMTLRQTLNSSTDKENPLYKLSVNDFIIKAVALALRDIPNANASWNDDAILKYNNIDVSVAVATPGGLITPIVRNAEQKSLITISNEMKDLIVRARANKLKPEEFQGGSFTISNLGMYNIKNFSAIINPPQSCILAVGATSERAVVKDGSIVAEHIMDVTLSCDHRVVDGAVGAEFLSAFKKYVEHPELALLY
ncbi:Dihydrolipoyllysine-residue acetyltransferase component of pyruvate dehydrogenase complex [Rickettsiales bacterium Ac37b]|nr:Dihydrolipoyllysine-residue acetyltransferase component of pyruvate dehydrogenase complex [Rickettsiales bacterium Ac37b]